MRFGFKRFFAQHIDAFSHFVYAGQHVVKGTGKIEGGNLEPFAAVLHLVPDLIRFTCLRISTFRPADRAR